MVHLPNEASKRRGRRDINVVTIALKFTTWDKDEVKGLVEDTGFMMTNV